MAWNLDDDRRRRRLRFFDMVTAFYTLARRASAPLQQVCRPAVPLLADRWRGQALAAWKQRNRLASLAHRTAVRIEAERTPQQSGGLRFVWFPVRTLPVVSARTPASISVTRLRLACCGFQIQGPLCVLLVLPSGVVCPLFSFAITYPIVPACRPVRCWEHFQKSCTVSVAVDFPIVVLPQQQPSARASVCKSASELAFASVCTKYLTSLCNILPVHWRLYVRQAVTSPDSGRCKQVLVTIATSAVGVCVCV